MEWPQPQREREAQQQQARKLGLAFADIGRVRMGIEMSIMLPIVFVQEHRIIPLKRDGKTLYLGVYDPPKAEVALAITEITGCRPVWVLAVLREIDEVIERWSA